MPGRFSHLSCTSDLAQSVFLKLTPNTNSSFFRRAFFLYIYLPHSTIRKKKEKTGSCLRGGSRRTRQFQISSPSALRLPVKDPFLQLRDSMLEAFSAVHDVRLHVKSIFFFSDTDFICCKAAARRFLKHQQLQAMNPKHLKACTGGTCNPEKGRFYLRDDPKHHHGLLKKGNSIKKVPTMPRMK